MLQNLLAERFGLKLHHLTREVSGYELVVGKDGPKLKPTGDPNAMPPAPGTAPPKMASGSDGFPSLPPGLSATQFLNVDNGTMRVTGQESVRFRFDRYHRDVAQ
jgi:uncharacterized protein (TIGR03435 family)